MCLESPCMNEGCGKPTWWGCGCHIEAVMSKIPAGTECQCENSHPARPPQAPKEKVDVHYKPPQSEASGAQ